LPSFAANKKKAPTILNCSAHKEHHIREKNLQRDVLISLYTMACGTHSIYAVRWLPQTAQTYTRRAIAPAGGKTAENAIAADFLQRAAPPSRRRRRVSLSLSLSISQVRNKGRNNFLSYSRVSLLARRLRRARKTRARRQCTRARAVVARRAAYIQYASTGRTGGRSAVPQPSRTVVYLAAAACAS
jgi:hypothetical protein